ncbi:hypothetical protein [Salinibacterium sp.]|uniref:hypothetical protein n=1 Tax=Salinibacterium sp. TaxID=1915057 RepID=UPI00286AD64C|nr:hypothetical protein [Salinibacterium sp.]
MTFEALEHDDLLFTVDLARRGLGPREIDHALGRRQLLRLRRGAFVRPEVWASASAAGQHILRITAVTAAARTRLVFARTSAAALWGMPLNDFPEAVVVLDRWRGGGRSEPGVIRTARGATTAQLAVRHGYECTTLARTVLDVCRGLTFLSAVPLLDWCLWERNPLAVTKEELVGEASSMKVSPALWRGIDFATPLSGSIGESEARGTMHQLGYPRPQLQRKFVDAEGAMFPDFYFEDDDAAVEFDGRIKYTRDEYTKGDPAEVVWQEKKREDRLRRQVRTVVRILTEDVRTPRLLHRKLSEAGIRRFGGGS